SDFGVARISALGGSKTETGVLKGKLHYMPPEQARGEPFDGRADIFALGITLYESLLGQRARRAETQAQLLVAIARDPVRRILDVMPNAPPALAAAIDGATEFVAGRRFPTAGDLAAHLQHALMSFGMNAEREAREEIRWRVESIADVPKSVPPAS